jgi:hypothetical protein
MTRQKGKRSNHHISSFIAMAMVAYDSLDTLLLLLSCIKNKKKEKKSDFYLIPCCFLKGGDLENWISSLLTNIRLCLSLIITAGFFLFEREDKAKWNSYFQA